MHGELLVERFELRVCDIPLLLLYHILAACASPQLLSIRSANFNLPVGVRSSGVFATGSLAIMPSKSWVFSDGIAISRIVSFSGLTSLIVVVPSSFGLTFNLNGVQVSLIALVRVVVSFSLTII